MKALLTAIWLPLRNLVLVLLALTAMAVTAETTGAPPTVTPEFFTLRLVHENLVISDMTPKDIATIIPETLGVTVHVGGCAFTVTYGHNPSGDLIAVITADPSNPRGLSFSVNGRHIEMEMSTAKTPISLTLLLTDTSRRDKPDDEAMLAAVLDEKPVVTALTAAGEPVPALPGAIDPLQNLDVAQIGASSFGNSYASPTHQLPTLGRVSINLNPRSTTPF